MVKKGKPCKVVSGRHKPKVCATDGITYDGIFYSVSGGYDSLLFSRIAMLYPYSSSRGYCGYKPCLGYI